MTAMRSPTTLAVGAILIAVTAYGGGCVLTSHTLNLAFAAVEAGDTKETVMDRFGTAPSMREQQSFSFRRYAIDGCMSPCRERWWYENHLTLDVEAWSITFDEKGRVITKAHWVSP